MPNRLRFFVALFSVFFTTIVCAKNLLADDLPLIPYPQTLTKTAGQFTLPSQVSLDIKAGDEFPVGNKSLQPQISAAADQLAQRLKKQTGVDVFFSPNTKTPATLIVQVQRPNSEPLLSTRAEAYSIKISKQVINLTAETPLGVLRGFETLLQLATEKNKRIVFPLVDIQDAPRFAWRGLLLDSSRHFFSVATIKRQLDAMAMAKLNVFHWHLTDDQGWRLELPSYPKLHQLASQGLYYTEADIRDVVAYANARGIAVMPEVDMPGHASAIALAYPELVSGTGPYAAETRWGVHTPSLNPTNEQVYAFADAVIAQLTRLFPFAYIHMGGDEVNPEEWNKNPQIQSFMRDKGMANAHDLQAYFNQRLVKILAAHNRKMIGWDEIQHPDLPRDIIIQSWRGPDAVQDAIHQGFQALLSTGFYLDQAQSSAYHYRNDPVPPQPLGAAVLNTGDSAQTRSFQFTRKRGGPVSGSFTLITHADGSQSGFIDFKDKSRRPLRQITPLNGQLNLLVDTWMGPLTLRFAPQESPFKGAAIVGNAAYPLEGEVTGPAPLEVQGQPLTATQQQAVLGGEAALWAEIVDESLIDLRLWPRGFTVAERLWSAADRRNENSLYQRLAAIDRLAQASIGLQNANQSTQLLARLAGPAAIDPLLVFSEALEQAQYYHRQHEKMSQASYSRADRLDLFVDSLPPENLHSRHLQTLIDQWLANPKDKQRRNALVNQFTRWVNQTPQLIALLESRPDLVSLVPLAHKVEDIASLGLRLVTAIDQQRPLATQELAIARDTIAKAQTIDNEMVISAAYPLEWLLDAASQIPSP